MALFSQLKKLAQTLRSFLGGKGTKLKESEAKATPVGDRSATTPRAVTTRESPREGDPHKLVEDDSPSQKHADRHDDKGSAYAEEIIQAPTAPAPSNVEHAKTEIAGERAQETDVILGFDFGTSSSKIVIRTPYILGGRAVAVPAAAFGSSRIGYLIPSGILVDGAGTVQCSKWLGDGSARPANLKIRLYQHPDDPDACARAVAFLAVCLRHAKRWYLSNELKALVGRHPRWAFNLGIPTPGYDDELIRGSFLKIARCAWKLSDDGNPVTLDTCLQVLSCSETNDPGIGIGVVPEIAAEVVGYARSHRRVDGLHLLVDVGAFTTDVCGFVLSKNGSDDQYSLLVSDVRQLGAHQLHYCREDIVGPDRCRDILKNIDLRDPFAVFPQWISDYCQPDDLQLMSYFERENAEFREPYGHQLMICLHSLRKKRDPWSDKWHEGLPVFLGGGGSDMKWYCRGVREIGARCQEYYRGVGDFQIRTLSKPEQLANEDVNPDMFRRIAVAYGLSFDEFDLGTIENPSEIGDVPPPRVRPPVEFISKDQV